MPRHHVLVGSGPASLAAAETIRARDASAEITIVTAEADRYYSRPGLAYLLARELPEAALFPFRPDDLARLGLRIVEGDVASIAPAAHAVTLADGRTMTYDRLLLATGSRAVPLDVPGATLDGVVKLDDLMDARDIVRRTRKARTAVIVGGGITALEIAEGLRLRGLHVHYLLRRDRYWGDVLSPAESELVENGLRRRGIEPHHGVELAEVIGRGGRVSGVRLSTGAALPCDILGVAIGVRPSRELAEAAGLACARGVLVDEYLRTSDPDVFAAGDIAETLDAESGRRTIEVLWDSAVRKGRAAGRNMADEPMCPYERPAAPLNVTRLAGYHVTIIGTVGSGRNGDMKGLSRGEAEGWRRVDGASTLERHDGDVHLRLVFAGDVIVGAVVMGEQASSYALQRLIEARTPLPGLEQRLREPDADVPALLQSAWTERRTG